MARPRLLDIQHLRDLVSVEARATAAFGLYLARRGFLVKVAMGVCAITVVGLSILAIVLAARGGRAPVSDVPLLASSALAWGGGFLHAFSSAAHALRRDRADGVRDLVVTRTTSLRGYLLARVGGLAAMLAITVAGGTLACGLVAIAASATVSAVPATLQATFAGVVFAIAFSAVVAPVAFAALGARSRVGGYLFLLAVVVAPELLATSLRGALGDGLAEVIAIPSALGALRAALAPGGFDALRALRAALALAAFVIVAVMIVRREAVIVAREEAGA